jgi:hypothetical protein
MAKVATSFPDVLHRVVDRHARRYGATGRVDVEVNVPVWVFGGEQQHLRADHVCHLVADLGAEEDDPLPEETLVHPIVELRGGRLLGPRRREDETGCLDARRGHESAGVPRFH